MQPIQLFGSDHAVNPSMVGLSQLFTKVFPIMTATGIAKNWKHFHGYKINKNHGP